MPTSRDSEEDFDWVKAKVPKQTAAGDDVSGDDYGTGGRRRDGHITALAYDFEPLEVEDATQRPTAPTAPSSRPQHQREEEAAENYDYGSVAPSGKRLEDTLQTIERVAELVEFAIVVAPKVKRWVDETGAPLARRVWAKRPRRNDEKAELEDSAPVTHRTVPILSFEADAIPEAEISSGQARPSDLKNIGDTPESAELRANPASLRSAKSVKKQSH